MKSSAADVPLVLRIHRPARCAAQSLVEQDLVRKEPSAIDDRGVVLTLTPKGAKIWQKLMQVIERRNREIVACLTAKEQEQLRLMTDRLVGRARQSSLSNEAS